MLINIYLNIIESLDPRRIYADCSSPFSSFSTFSSKRNFFILLFTLTQVKIQLCKNWCCYSLFLFFSFFLSFLCFTFSHSVYLRIPQTCHCCFQNIRLKCEHLRMVKRNKYDAHKYCIRCAFDKPSVFILSLSVS